MNVSKKNAQKRQPPPPKRQRPPKRQPPPQRSDSDPESTGQVKDDASVVDVIANWIAQLSAHLLVELDKHKGQNLIYSPFGLHVLMGMVKVGARGETNNEIANGLTYPDEDKDLKQGYAKVLSSLQPKAKAKWLLSTANGIFVDRNFKIHEAFKASMKKDFLCELEAVDFTF